MKEVEILIEVKESLESILEKLNSFTSKGTKQVVDTYFFDPLRDELKSDENGSLSNAFRIRDMDGKGYITYKKDYFTRGVWSHSDELETEIADPSMGVEIAGKLGLEELVKVESLKQIFTTEEYEIVLESVKDLGVFLEVEKLEEVGDDEVENTKEEIREFITSLGINLGNEQVAGKPELLLKKHSVRID